jgi:hypothetical protein
VTGPAKVPQTALKRRYQRIRELGLERQTRECADYLENPEVLVAEFVDSRCAMERFAASGKRMPRGKAPDPAGAARAIALLAGTTRIVLPDAEGCTFHLVWAGEKCAAPVRFIDYAGLTDDAPVTPILGAVVDPAGRSPFLTFLRLLIGLAEVGAVGCSQGAVGELFEGALRTPMAFDLHILLCDGAPQHRSQPLHQLTWDLAQAFSTRIGEEWLFPNPLRRISCLELDGERFDGTLEVAWSV